MLRLVIPILFLSGSLCFSDTLITKDVTRHSGTLQSATANSVTFKEGVQIRHYRRSDIRSIEFDDATVSDYAPPTSSPSSARHVNDDHKTGSSVTLPAGTEIVVMTNDSIDSATANEGQSFSADVAENVTNSAGRIVIPKGSEAELALRKVQAQGKRSEE